MSDICDQVISIKDGKLFIKTRNELMEFELKKYSAEEVLALRIKVFKSGDKNHSYLIVKSGKSNFVAETPRNAIRSNIRIKHICEGCDHCYACDNSISPKGTKIIIGCPKIIDRFYFAEAAANKLPSEDEFETKEEYQTYVKKRFEDNIISSKRIEKYDFIKFGLETFNCTTPIFVVVNCFRFEDDPPRTKKHSFFQVESLYRYFYPDSTKAELINTIAKADKRIRMTAY